MRGFVLSLVSMLFLIFLFLIATSLHDHYLAMERTLTASQPLSYAAFAVDQSGHEINTILGPRISMSSSNVSFGLAVRQDVPSENVSHLLSDYEDLLEDGLATESHAVIEADFSPLYDGPYEMNISDRFFFSNGPGGQMVFRGLAKPGWPADTDVYSYEINITVPKYRKSMKPTGKYSPVGFNVTINYLDLNGSFVEETTLHPADTSRFEAEYMDNSTLTIILGRESNNDGSLIITVVNTFAQVSWSGTFPPLNSSEKAGYGYDALITYISGDHSVSRRPGT